MSSDLPPREKSDAGAPASGPGFHPSDRAPMGLAADGVSIPRAQREAIAIIVYEAMRWAAEHASSHPPPQWVERGNALAQDRARQAADAIASGIEAPIGDETRSGSTEGNSAVGRKPETPEARAKAILTPLEGWFADRPKVIAAVANLIRACENDALERAATAAHSAIFDKNQRDPSTPASDYSAAATDAIRSLKHKEPS